jgi:hypothetical protein
MRRVCEEEHHFVFSIVSSVRPYIICREATTMQAAHEEEICGYLKNIISVSREAPFVLHVRDDAATSFVTKHTFV